jgi:hypothetical protein
MPFILNEDPFVEMDDNGGVDSNAESWAITTYLWKFVLQS